MEMIVGVIKSINSGFEYKVKWDSESQSAWILRKGEIWEQVCTKVFSAEVAISCAQKHIDFQSGLY